MFVIEESKTWIWIRKGTFVYVCVCDKERDDREMMSLCWYKLERVHLYAYACYKERGKEEEEFENKAFAWIKMRKVTFVYVCVCDKEGEKDGRVRERIVNLCGYE